MNNNCKHLKQGFGKLKCNKLKKEITFNDCKNCEHKEYKKVEHSKTQQKVSENTAKTQRNTAKAKSGRNPRKAVEKSAKSGSIKQRTHKQAKLERDRFSIFTDNLDVCYLCANKKDDLHEIFMGAKRITSIKYGLVLPLCRLHHLEMHNDTETRLKWNKIGQSTAMEHYSWNTEEFIEVFGRNYLL